MRPCTRASLKLRLLRDDLSLTGLGRRLVDWCMAKDVPRVVIRTGLRAEYTDESQGIFVSRPFRHSPPTIPTDHRTTER